MSIVWAVTDTLRKAHMGPCGNSTIHGIFRDKRHEFVRELIEFTSECHD